MKETKYGRRRFLSGAAMSLGAIELAAIDLTNTSFTNNKYKEIMKNDYKGSAAFSTNPRHEKIHNP